MSEFAIPTLPVGVEQSDEKPKPPALKYEKPVWSTKPSFDYRLEVLKNGQSIETIPGPSKEFITIGRLPLCDVLMEHPSISRYHAVIQFNEDGDAYIYDLESAHGTKVNKKTIGAREYIALKPGDQLRFGESTRICIFDSEKPYDPEAEILAKRESALRKKIAEARGQPSQEEEEEEGISWGFGEDAVEEEEEDEDDTEYNQHDIEANLNKSGDASLLNIEAAKMAIEDAKRRREDLEIMYGDDSDEELYDKTSRKKSKKVEKAATHEELVVQQRQAEAKIKKLEADLEERKKLEKDTKDDEEEDLDAYMNTLSKKPLDNSKSLFALQKELNQLRKDNERLIKLVKLTKPSHIL